MKLSAAFVVVLYCAKWAKRQKRIAKTVFAKEYKWKKFEGDYIEIVWQYYEAISYHDDSLPLPIIRIYSLLRLIANINFRRFRQNVLGSKTWIITAFLLPSLLQFRCFFLVDTNFKTNEKYKQFIFKVGWMEMTRP